MVVILSLMLAGSAGAADDGPAPVAVASAAAGAILVELSGDVTCRCSDESASPVSAFQKVRAGDVLVLGEASEVVILFFGTGRRERWSSASEVTIGAEGGQADGAEPEVVELGADVGAVVGNMPVILTRVAKGRNAGTLVRGKAKAVTSLTPDEKAVLDKARARYDELRARLPDSLVPDLYLITVLIDYGQHPEAAKAIEAARPRCSAGCAVLDQLAAWVAER